VHPFKSKNEIRKAQTASPIAEKLGAVALNSRPDILQFRKKGKIGVY
jgi:hypothetical protein